MASNYTEKELAALKAKEQAPNSEVICPRCGKNLLYIEVGNSYEIKCPTENCLKRTVSGFRHADKQADF